MSDDEPWVRLYAAVGECLHAWSIVEAELTTLFVVMHERAWNDFDHPLRAAFEAVISLEARLGMIKATAEADAALRDSYPAHWTKLQSKLLKSYRKRHEVAHFTLVGRIRGASRTHLIRPFFKWKDFNDQAGVELDLKQIEERKVAFYALTERVRQHVQHVGAKKGLTPSHFAQAGHIAYPDLDEAGATDC